MQVNKDILKYLKIETCYILANNTTYLCMPIEIKKHSWFIVCDSGELSGFVKLKIKYRNSFIYFNTQIISAPTETHYGFTYELIFDEKDINKDEFIKTFFADVNKTITLDNQWNKRKEERYEIGLNENLLELIKFKSFEQSIVIDKSRLPCLVNNISYGGAKLTTTEGNFSKDTTLMLELSFIKPIEKIYILGFVRNCLIKSTSDKKIISILSIKFSEKVIPINFKMRLDEFIENLKMEGAWFLELYIMLLN